jgi:hypothetical protein
MMSYNHDQESSDGNDMMNSWLEVEIGKAEEIDDDDNADEQTRFLSPDFEIGAPPIPNAMNSPRFRDFPVHDSYFAHSPQAASKRRHDGENSRWRATEIPLSPAASTSSLDANPLKDSSSLLSEAASPPGALDRMDPKEAWTSVANLAVGKHKRNTGRGGEIPVELYEHQVLPSLLSPLFLFFPSFLTSFLLFILISFHSSSTFINPLPPRPPTGHWLARLFCRFTRAIGTHVLLHRDRIRIDGAMAKG